MKSIGEIYSPTAAVAECFARHGNRYLSGCPRLCPKAPVLLAQFQLEMFKIQKDSILLYHPRSAWEMGNKKTLSQDYARSQRTLSWLDGRITEMELEAPAADNPPAAAVPPAA